LLQQADAPAGCLFGQFSDRQIYGQVLGGDGLLFLNLAEQLALDWVRHEIDWVVGDAYEGAIMTHDLWRGVIDRAVEIARAMSGRTIENVGFSLEKNPAPQWSDDPSIYSIRQLDAAAWRTKVLAAESYPELREEVQAAFATWGRAAFQYETLLIQPPPRERPDWRTPPEYERHGERQVSAGIYSHVVRYREHVLPILQELAVPVAAKLPKAA
jgi:hypothetical protein